MILPFARPEPTPLRWIDVTIPPSHEPQTVRIDVYGVGARLEDRSDRRVVETGAGPTLAIRYLEAVERLSAGG